MPRDSIARLRARGRVPHPLEHWLQQEAERGGMDAETYWFFRKPPSGPGGGRGQMRSRRAADASAMLRCPRCRDGGGGMSWGADAWAIRQSIGDVLSLSLFLGPAGGLREQVRILSEAHLVGR